MQFALAELWEARDEASRILPVAALAAPVLELLRTGGVRPRVTRTFPLAEAAEAHRLLAGRQTMGKLLIQV